MAMSLGAQAILSCQAAFLKGKLPLNKVLLPALKQAVVEQSLPFGLQVAENLRAKRNFDPFLWTKVADLFRVCKRPDLVRGIYNDTPSFLGDKYAVVSFLRSLSDEGASDEATRIFRLVSSKEKDIVAWSSYISALTKSPGEAVLEALQEFRLTGLPPDPMFAMSWLKTAAAVGDRRLVESSEQLVAEAKCLSDTRIQNALLNTYARCGEYLRAKRLFDTMSKSTHDVTSITCLLLATQGAPDVAAAINDVLKFMTTSDLKPDVAFMLVLARVVGVSRDSALAQKCTEIFQTVKIQGNTVLVSLMDMLTKCGLVDRARATFDKIPTSRRELAMWNVMIAACVHWTDGEATASKFLSDLQSQRMISQYFFSLPFKPELSSNRITVLAVLKVGSKFRSGHLVDRAVALATSNQTLADPHVQVALIDSWGKCGKFDLALAVFKQIPSPQPVHWNSLFGSLLSCSSAIMATRLIEQAVASKVALDRISVLCIMNVASHFANFRIGRLGVNLAARLGLDSSDSLIQCAMITMYAKCGDFDSAWQVFQRSQKEQACWNAILSASQHQLNSFVPTRLFTEMIESMVAPTKITVLSLLACASHFQDLQLSSSALDLAHRLNIRNDSRVVESAINMLGVCGQYAAARQYLDEYIISAGPPLQPTTDMFNSLIQGAGTNDLEVLRLLSDMETSGVPPNERTVICALKCVSQTSFHGLGKRVVELVQDLQYASSPEVATALVEMYSRCKQPQLAINSFNNVPVPTRNIFLYNALLNIADNEMDVKQMLGEMQINDVLANRYTALVVLKLASKLKSVELGDRAVRICHDAECAEQPAVLCALIHMYGCCGDYFSARRVFDRIPVSKREVSHWNVLLGATASCTNHSTAQVLLSEFKASGLKPTVVTALSLFGLAARFASRDITYNAVVLAREYELLTDVDVLTSAIHACGRAGQVDISLKLFSSAPESVHSLSVWNAVIAALARDGRGKDAYDMYLNMRSSSLFPDEITVTSLLQAFSHSFMEEQAKNLFLSLDELHVSYNARIITAYIDVLARSNRLAEAELVLNLLSHPEPVSFLTILGGCRIHGDVQTASRIFEVAISKFPQESSIYVLYSNILAFAGDVKGSRAIHLRRIKSGAIKTHGLTTAYVGPECATFNANYNDHSEIAAILAKMQEMYDALVLDGHSPDTSWVTKNLHTEEAKKKALCHHSERFALAFSLIKSAPGEELFLVNNLRVCGECHETTKRISRIYNRPIVVRDASRFHRFQDALPPRRSMIDLNRSQIDLSRSAERSD